MNQDSKQNLWHSTPGSGLVAVSPKVDFPALDHAVLDHWKDHDVFQRTISERQDCPDFVAYDGPPGTNGTPHIGHMMQSALKDLWPRYKTMQGYRVLRKAGWDTHGLPIELTAEKELGFKTKRDIEAYGVEKYIQYCQSTVFRYRDEWIKAINRIGRFLDTDNDYATYRKEYIETDWWVLKQAWDKGLLYQKRRIMPYCSRCGTSLSQHETAQGYKDVQDISIYVKFQVVGQEKTFFVAWTTTPWTLLSNVALAVNPDMDYVTVRTDDGECLIIAEQLKSKLLQLWVTQNRVSSLNKLVPGAPPESVFHEATGGGTYGGSTTISSCKGSALVGLRYEPLWDWQLERWGKDVVYGTIPDRIMGAKYSNNDQNIELTGVFAVDHSKPPCQVIADTYVTADDGSGIVHLALYGQDDYRLIGDNNLPPVQNVDLDGRCAPNTGAYAGRDIHEKNEKGEKKLDIDIVTDLKLRGLRFASQRLPHSYPHCYRCDTPLMYFAMSGWFLRTSSYKDQMLAANDKINWYPEHIKEGRFGNWLENNVDWNISRARYWGSPIPIWHCDECAQDFCVGSLADLEELYGQKLPADFDPHKPYIDNLVINCPGFSEETLRQLREMGLNPSQSCSGQLHRVPEVLDSWFNAGIMPWGQWGYPAKPGSEELFNRQFPADFICEAIDQTRGWFYTLLATSTLLTMKETETPARGGESRVAADSNPPNTVVGLETDATRFTGGTSSFKNVICTELINDADGKKMSKSRGNVIDPMSLCEKYGADAVRWTFYSVNPWTSRRFAESDLGEVLKQVLIPYWNCYSFFVTYARVDGWKPERVAADSNPPDKVVGLETDATWNTVVGLESDPTRPNPLDRWILSRLVWLDESVRKGLDGYDVMSSAQAFSQFLDELTNWHIRRSRRRFWKSEDDSDKQLAYRTLHQVLSSMNRMLAPFMPFVSEVVYQNIERGFDASLPDSVHLAKWPEVDANMRDLELENKMDTVRRIVSLARSLRADNNVRVRQPLREVAISLPQISLPQTLDLDLEEMVLEELNVKNLRRVEEASDLFSWQAKGDPKSLGPKYGAKMKEVLAVVNGLEHSSIMKLLQDGKLEVSGLTLLKEDLILSQQPAEGFWVRSEGNITVAVRNIIDDELTSEWLVREFIHHIQNMRRDAGFEVTDRIAIDYCGDRVLRDAIVHHIRYIAGETLALSIVTTLESDAAEVRIGDKACRVQIRRLN